MLFYKQLQKNQERLNKELLECPVCGVMCEWGELIEGAECGACWKDEEYSRRADIDAELEKEK